MLRCWFLICANQQVDVSISCRGIHQLLDHVFRPCLELGLPPPTLFGFQRTQERGAGCVLVTTLGFTRDVPEVYMHHRPVINVLETCSFVGVLPALGGRASLTPWSLGQMSEFMLLLLLWVHVLRQWYGFTVPDQIVFALPPPELHQILHLQDIESTFPNIPSCFRFWEVRRTDMPFSSLAAMTLR